MKLQLLPKAKKGQVVTNVVAGIGALVILVIITYVIITTLNDSQLLGVQDSTVIQVNNESPSWLNATNYTLEEGDNSSTGGHTIIRMWNKTGPNLVPSGYHQLDSRVLFTNGSTYESITDTSNETNVTYTYWYKYGEISAEQNATTNMIGNFTSGIDEVSKKLPVILLIVAVVFLFGALVLLVQQSKRMGIGTSGGL